MKPTVYTVQPSRGEWIVVRQGGTRPEQRFPRKREAVEHAVELARETPPSRLRIWRMDLTVQEERRYEPEPA